MGLLFGTPKPPPEGPPPGSDNRHSYAGNELQPGENIAYVPAAPNWAPSWRLMDAHITHTGTVADPINQIDQPTNNPNPDIGPDPFNARRNSDKLARAANDERPPGYGGGGKDSWDVTQVSGSERRALPPTYFASQWDSNRPTAHQSPSNYRFLHVMRSGQGDVPHLNGTHFSMASMHRNYPIRGMQPARRFRNTWRLEPPPRDAQNVDIPQGGNPSVPNSVFVSSNAPTPGPSSSWRL